jgi:N6-adenosine-specific RNA methylase IME4
MGGAAPDSESLFAALPRVEGGFRSILADPRWRFETWSMKGQDRAPPYATVPLAAIAALPVASIAAADCSLFLWATWPHLPQALELIGAWGFVYTTCAFSWMKADPYRLFADDKTPTMGMGYWTRANTEPCLLATRGRPKRLARDVRQGIIAPKREHSRKPDCVYDRIERLVEAPRLELFARAPREGWTSWGDELPPRARPKAAE